MVVPAGAPVHGLPPRGADHVGGVQRLGGHRQLAAALHPGGARPVGVHLDAEPIGVGEVDGLAHEVVRHPRVRADLPQVRQEPPQRRAVGKEDGEVVQPQQPAPGHRPHAGLLAQLQQRRVVAVRAQHRAAAVALQHAEAGHLAVVAQRPLQIRHLQHHPADVGLSGQPEALGRDAVLPVLRRLRRGVHPSCGCPDAAQRVSVHQSSPGLRRSVGKYLL